mgnify:CR=1 FL=1
MANYKLLIPFILCYEGGFVNDPTDRGGATNRGITMATWRAYCTRKGKPATIQTLKAMTQSEWTEIFKTQYWDKCKADLIADQSLASMLVDYAWHSGIFTAIRALQMVLSITADGAIGPQTLKAINSCPPRTIFEALKQARLKHLNNIARLHPSQRKYLRGWTNRVNAITYGKLSYK